MTGVREPDGFPEIDSSATRLGDLPEKYLDVEGLTCRFVEDVISGKRNYDDHFLAIAEPHHHRARLHADGHDVWQDVHYRQCFDVTTEVRTRVAARRPMTGPHPHNWPESWRDDGKCIVKSCGVWRVP